MDTDVTEQAAISPASQTWLRYYEDAARRRGGHGDLDQKRLRRQRKRRKKIERAVILMSLVGVLGLAWILAGLLSR